MIASSAARVRSAREENLIDEDNILIRHIERNLAGRYRASLACGVVISIERHIEAADGDIDLLRYRRSASRASWPSELRGSAHR